MKNIISPTVITIIAMSVIASALSVSGCSSQTIQTSTASAPAGSSYVPAQTDSANLETYALLQLRVLPPGTERCIWNDDTLYAFPSGAAIPIKRYADLYPQSVEIVKGVAVIGMARK